VTGSDCPPAGYRPCVGIALFNRSGQVFIGHRAGIQGPHGWQMPQGGLDEGESAIAAARRELHEETGATSVHLLAEAPGWLTYDLPPEALRASWHGRFRGQAQRWVAFRFDGEDSEIDVLAPPDGHKPEFDAWRWATLAETPDLIVPFKRQVYQKVAILFAGFSNLT
jgi:putative (di)nucleoside polyphosphate hydrolase